MMELTITVNPYFYALLPLVRTVTGISNLVDIRQMGKVQCIGGEHSEIVSNIFLGSAISNQT